MSNTSYPLKWVVANALGLGLGFILLLQVDMTLRYGVDTEKYWQFGQPWDFSVWMYIRRLIGALIFGAFYGFAQSIVLRSTSKIKSSSWVITTAIGLGVLEIIIDWPLRFVGLGNLPGPLDPILVTVGGGISAGAAQYFLLLRKGIRAEKWLVLWIAGLFLSLIPTALFFMSIGSLSWPIEVFINGFIVGGVAAWISGKAFLAALKVDQ